MKVQVQRENGVLKVDIDGEKYMPLSFKSFRPNPKNISEFYNAGIRLFSVLSSGVESALGVLYSLYGESWIGEYEYDFSAIDKQMDMFIKNAPDAYFAPMLQLDTRKWYMAAHSETPNSFLCLSQMCADKAWREAAQAYLKAAIAHIEAKYGDKVYGYFLLCGTTTEWFSGHDREAPHLIKEQAYKKWLNDENATLPSLTELEKAGAAFLDADEENVYNARKFHSEIIAETILNFTKIAKEATNRNKLVGLYYGYLLELDNQRIYNFGSLAYEKIFLSDDIDMISSPSSYIYRAQRDPSAFMVTQKTLDKHNKLYFLEFDHITHLAPTMVNDAPADGSTNNTLTKIPGADNKCKNQDESLNLMYRDFLLCNAHGAALWWFDMFDGWFRSDEMMGMIKNVIGINKALGDREKTELKDIAVIFEGESMYHVRKTAKLENFALERVRKALASCGAAYDLYSVSDLTLSNMCGYKLIILANQYEMSLKTLETIEKIKKSGTAVLYTYAPNYLSKMNCDIVRMSKTVGMNIELSEQDNTLSFPSPHFHIKDTSVTPISYYENGNVSAGYIKNENELSIYSACPLDFEIIRKAAELAKVHIYSENENVYTYVNSQSIGVYNATDFDAKINVPGDGEYTDLLSGEKYQSDNGKLILPLKPIRAYLLIK